MRNTYKSLMKITLMKFYRRNLLQYFSTRLYIILTEDIEELKYTSLLINKWKRKIMNKDMLINNGKTTGKRKDEETCKVGLSR